jgi:hypothetical protein
VIVSPDYVQVKLNGTWKNLPGPSELLSEPGESHFRFGKIRDVFLLARVSGATNIARLDPGTSRWEASLHDDSHELTDFVVHDTVVYVGTANGVLRSRDRGVTWASAASGITNPEVLALTIAGDQLVAATPAGVEVLDLARDDAH